MGRQLLMVWSNMIGYYIRVKKALCSFLYNIIGSWRPLLYEYFYFRGNLAEMKRLLPDLTRKKKNVRRNRSEAASWFALRMARLRLYWTWMWFNIICGLTNMHLDKDGIEKRVSEHCIRTLVQILDPMITKIHKRPQTNSHHEAWKCARYNWVLHLLTRM